MSVRALEAIPHSTLPHPARRLSVFSIHSLVARSGLEFRVDEMVRF
jgi:hypothetical protein